MQEKSPMISSNPGSAYIDWGASATVSSPFPMPPSDLLKTVNSDSRKELSTRLVSMDLPRVTAGPF